MSRAVAVLAVAITCIVTGARAQQVHVGVFGTTVLDREVEEGRSADGLGIGATAAWRPGRLWLEIEAITASLDPARGTGLASFDFRTLSVRAGYRVAGPVAVELGAFRRWANPEFFAQDVGAVRFGIGARTRIAERAWIQVRGAWLAFPHFSGGGDGGFAGELGVATELALGRFILTAGYQLQRIDREVTGTDTPIQYSDLRLGVGLGLW